MSAILVKATSVETDLLLLDGIVGRVAESFGLQPHKILSRDRSEPAATARKVAMVLVYDRLRNATRVARLFERDHSTVLWAIRNTDAALLDAVRNGRKVDCALLNRHCLCGNPATKRDSAHSWVCERCAEIEARITWDYSHD